MSTQVYSYQNKEEILRTISLSFCNWSNGHDWYYNYALLSAISYSSCL